MGYARSIICLCCLSLESTFCETIAKNLYKCNYTVWRSHWYGDVSSPSDFLCISVYQVSMAMEWELSLFWVPEAQVCVCVWGELMRTEWLSFPGFPNPICSNKRLKGKEKETLLVKGGGIITHILGQHFNTCNPFILCLDADKRKSGQCRFHLK